MLALIALIACAPDTVALQWYTEELDCIDGSASWVAPDEPLPMFVQGRLVGPSRTMWVAPTATGTAATTFVCDEDDAVIVTWGVQADPEE